MDAFLPGVCTRLAPNGAGPLDGLTFAVKDLIDLAGARTGCGNPQWLARALPATASAPCVQALLDAGAACVGKTHTDEFAFSLEGRNQHYGTPLNPACPTCLPGGSSSGSASAVAQGLADFALGTDTGGSVRTPAAFCGLYGLRPSHGRVPLEGVMPFAPGYDTVGWLAWDLDVLAAVSAVLMPDGDDRPLDVARLHPLTDAFALAGPATRDRLWPLARALGAGGPKSVFDGDEQAWLSAYQTLQARDIRDGIGAGLVRHGIALSDAIAPRFATAMAVTDAEVAQAETIRARARRRLAGLIPEHGALVIPGAIGPAPIKGLDGDALNDFYARALTLNAIAGHAGLPQLCVPAGTLDGCPLSLALVGRPGDDRRLIASARQWIERADSPPITRRESCL